MSNKHISKEYQQFIFAVTKNISKLNDISERIFKLQDKINDRIELLHDHGLRGDNVQDRFNDIKTFAPKEIMDEKNIEHIPYESYVLHEDKDVTSVSTLIDKGNEIVRVHERKQAEVDLKKYVSSRSRFEKKIIELNKLIDYVNAIHYQLR
jgi:hypothetical protein